jgi:hypothetical protein
MSTDATRSKLINIRSFDLKSGSDSDFVIDLGNHGIPSIKKVVLKSAYYTNSVYNITAAKNQSTLTLTFDNTNSLTVALPDGHYTTATLISTLVPLINAQLILLGYVQTMSMTYSSTYSRFVMTLTAGLRTFIIEPLSLSGIMGFVGGQTLALTQSASFPPDLIGLRIIHINSQKLAGDNMLNSDGYTSHTLLDIPCNEPYGNQVYYGGSDDELNSIEYPKHLSNIRQIDIKLLDQDFQKIDFQGFPFSCILKVYF